MSTISLAIWIVASITFRCEPSISSQLTGTSFTGMCLFPQRSSTSMSKAHLSRCWVGKTFLAASREKILKPHYVSLMLLRRTNLTSWFMPHERNLLIIFLYKSQLSGEFTSVFDSSWYLLPIAHDSPFFSAFLHSRYIVSKLLISVAPSASAKST